MDKNELKKDLYKSKAIAKLVFYDPANGDLIYSIEALGKIWNFPIHTISVVRSPFDFIEPNIKVRVEVDTLILTDDLKGAKFGPEMKGSSLIRWIEQAIDKNEFHGYDN
jgi:hypothetical protein